VKIYISNTRVFSGFPHNSHEFTIQGQYTERARRVTSDRYCFTFTSSLKANSHMPCRSPVALIHTRHAKTLTVSDSAVFFGKVRTVDGNIRTASLLLVTTFVELRVVAGRSRTRTGRTHAVSGRPMLIHTYHAVPMPLLCRAVPWP
jgi:hypothetical protein